MSPKTAEVQAAEILAAKKFHQLFEAPATETRGPLRVSYSIAGIEEGEDVETIMFCGGMFGTRLQAVSMDWLATKNGVRVLYIDR